MSENQKIKDAIFFTAVFLCIAWALFLMDEYLGFRIKRYGMFPREVEGLRGIFSMHFLHGSWKHIWGNSLSFAVLTTMLFYFYRKISFKVFIYIAIFGGILLWLGGRPSNHIGASLIIFGEAFFLFFAGIFSKNPKLLRIGLVVAFYYGSMVWYLFPIDPDVSWEGHLAGALVGVFLAYRYKEQTPKRSKTRWEIEEELEEQYKNLWDDEIVIRGASQFINVKGNIDVETPLKSIDVPRKIINKSKIIEIPITRKNFNSKEIEKDIQSPNIVYHYRPKKKD